MYDLWRSGFSRTPLQTVARKGLETIGDIVWLPAPRRSFRYHADPFGMERGGIVTIFVEAYDHRTRHGRIEYFQYDGSVLVRHGIALERLHHLSYPQIIAQGDALYMLPEAYKSGRLTLYRCDRFPDLWTEVQDLLELPVVDPTPVCFDGRWWLFFAVAGPNDQAMRELHIAWADALEGPWTLHTLNPVRRGWLDARPGGAAFVHEGVVHLPVQHCRPTYGAGLTLLKFDRLTPTEADAHPVSSFGPTELLPGFEDGLHTLSGDDALTCIDVKSVRSSPAEPLVKLQYKIRRLARRRFRKGKP